MTKNGVIVLSELVLKLNSGIIYDVYDRPTMIINIKTKNLMSISEYDDINSAFDTIRGMYATLPEQNAEDIIMLELKCQQSLDKAYIDIDYAIELYEKLEKGE